MCAVKDMSLRVTVLVTLFAVLVFGGVVQYWVILDISSPWGLTVPSQVRSYRAEEEGFGQNLYQRSPYGGQRPEKDLQRLGKKGVSAVRGKLAGVVESGAWEVVPESKKPVRRDSFYDRREILLSRMDELMGGFEAKHNERSSGLRDFQDRIGLEKNRFLPPDDKGDLDGNGYLHFPADLAEVESIYGPEILMENDTSLPRKKLTPFAAVGNNIMLTLRTVKNYHSKRLPLLFSTWLTKVNGSNVFLMTDGMDPVWQNRVWKRGI